MGEGGVIAKVISIHAPRVGGDIFIRARKSSWRDFNPRPPCGGRPVPFKQLRILRLISIHAPRVGGDPIKVIVLTPVCISIHAPRVGGDPGSDVILSKLSAFQSTPPVWGATQADKQNEKTCRFQSTPPVWGATPPVLGRLRHHSHFNPRPPCGGRLLQ